MERNDSVTHRSINQSINLSFQTRVEDGFYKHGLSIYLVYLGSVVERSDSVTHRSINQSINQSFNQSFQTRKEDGFYKHCEETKNGGNKHVFIFPTMFDILVENPQFYSHVICCLCTLSS